MMDPVKLLTACERWSKKVEIKLLRQYNFDLDALLKELQLKYPK